MSLNGFDEPHWFDSSSHPLRVVNKENLSMTDCTCMCHGRVIYVWGGGVAGRHDLRVQGSRGATLPVDCRLTPYWLELPLFPSIMAASEAFSHQKASP